MAFFARPNSTSSAVRIVRPQGTEDDGSSKASRKDSTQRQCKNILIHGSCKYQDKGCAFYHPPSSSDATPPTAPGSPRVSSPAPALSAEAVNAPVFVPKSTLSTSSVTSSPEIPVFIPASKQASQAEQQYTQTAEQEDHDPYDPYDPYSYPTSSPGPSNGTNGSLDQQMQSLQMGQYDFQPPGRQDSQPSQMGMGMYDEYDPSGGVNGMDMGMHMDPYYHAPQAAFIRQPLNYHLYSAPTPLFIQSRFLPDDLRETLTRRAEVRMSAPAVPPPGIPDMTQGYHTLMPLESTGGERRKFGNWYSVVYKAVSERDGDVVALRRVENYRLMHQAAFGPIEAWSRIQHPAIVSVREAFTTRAFNDNSLLVAYDYYPDAQTLFDTHLSPAVSHAPIPERTLWAYFIQIAAAIRAVHERGLAVRVIDATKILVVGQNRVRIGSCGIVDVLTYMPGQPPPPAPGTPGDPTLVQHQQEDLAAFARLVFALTTRSAAALSNFPKAVDAISRNYSGEMKAFALFVAGATGGDGRGGKVVHAQGKVAGGRHQNQAFFIDKIFEVFHGRLVAEVEDAYSDVSRLEGELMSELENARLVRLMCKFGFINERPEFARDPRWSETGDRYIIKLFRDYVFHQVDETGNPVVNMTHVLTCLNKVDAGTDERIMLVSRDEQSCLVVSYKEIKSCIESAFGDLTKSSSYR